MRHIRRKGAVLLVSAVACVLAASAATAAPKVVANGLNNPRGLAFGPDGTLYIAEAGTGGDWPCFTNSEPTFVCFGGTGAITQVRKGVQSRIVIGLPSVAAKGGGGATGPHDVGLLGNGRLLVSIGLGAPPSTVAPGGVITNSALGELVRVTRNGHWKRVANLAEYEGSTNPDKTDLDTNPYGLLVEPGRTIVADAGANSVVSISASGEVSTLAVLPPVMGKLPFPPFATVPADAVPTAVAKGPDGALYVSQLTGFPFPVGGSTVWRLGDGGPTPFRRGFTNVVDLAFGPDGSLYVVEIDSSSILAPPEMIGSLIKVAPDGTQTTLAGDLFSPGGVALDKAGTPYVSVCSVCPGKGQVLAFG